MSDTTILEGRDYEFVEKPDSPMYSVRLLRGPWAGIVYTYGVVTLHEDHALDRLHVTYQFTLEENPEGREIYTSSEFKNYIGQILTSIMEKDGKTGKLPTPDE
jgi:hypothetical protein